MVSCMPNKLSIGLINRFKKYGTKKIDRSVTLKSVYTKYDGICQNCGIRTEHIHPPRPNSASMEHIIPLSSGGSHTWDNVELLCHKCNTGRNTNMQNENIVKAERKPITRKNIKILAKHIKTFKVFGYTIKITKDKQ